MATQTLTTPSGIWQELGVTSGMDLPPAHRLKCYVMSLPGMGKTWFGASIPDALHIDFEDQAKFVPAPRANRVVITSGKQLDELVEKLIDTAADNPWSHVIWDTIEHSLGVIIPTAGHQAT